MELLKTATHDILRDESQIKEVCGTCCALVPGSGQSHCEVLLFGPSDYKPTFITALKRHEQLVVKIYEKPSKDSSLIRINQIPRTARKSKLAIVGMAGRFPDAADHEKLWQLLEAGLDVHREVSTTCAQA